MRERGAADCEILLAPVDVKLGADGRTVVQPDLALFCHRDYRSGGEATMEEPPDLVVEILSRSTWKKDMFVKLSTYQQSGIREYWIVDPFHEKILVYDFVNEALPESYTFEDRIPVGIADGTCSIDFGEVKRSLW